MEICTFISRCNRNSKFRICAKRKSWLAPPPPCSMIYDQYMLGLTSRSLAKYPRAARIEGLLKAKTPAKRRPRGSRGRGRHPHRPSLSRARGNDRHAAIVAGHRPVGTGAGAAAEDRPHPYPEALQRLARDGLVVIMPRRGIMVSEINLRLQLRLLEVRRELERLMARLAAERATPEERARIRRNCERHAGGGRKIRRHRLHAAGPALQHPDRHRRRNEFARRSMGLMNALSRRFWYQHYQEVADLPLAAKLHAAVADAVRRKRRRRASRRHLGSTDRLYRGFRAQDARYAVMSRCASSRTLIDTANGFAALQRRKAVIDFVQRDAA